MLETGNGMERKLVDKAHFGSRKTFLFYLIREHLNL